MALTEEEKTERSRYLEENLRITDCYQPRKYCFISYASDNWETVFKQAVTPLQKKYGLRVYADKAFESKSDDWIGQMSENMKYADAVLAFISQSYTESYACFLEILSALLNKKQIVFIFIDKKDPTLSTSKIPFNTTNEEKQELADQIECIIAKGKKSSVADHISTMYDGLINNRILRKVNNNTLSKRDISAAFIDFLNSAGINKMRIDNLDALFEPKNGEFKNLCDAVDANAAPQTNSSNISAAGQSAHSEDAAVPAAPAPKSSSKIVKDKYFCYFITDSKGKQTKVAGTYTGAWKDGCPNGQGSMKFYCGDVYEGEWMGGERNGHGIIKYVEGDIYDGEWKNNKRSGHGKYTWADGSVYDGEWKDGKQNGLGMIKYSDGRVYEGEWRNGAADGEGTFTWTSGKTYKGSFKNGMQNGYGIMNYSKNKVHVYEGEWEDDKRSGKGKYTYNGDFYEGEFGDDKFNGHGVMKYADGGIYDGDWKKGKRSGSGIMKFPNGEVYEGELKDDKRNGRGIMKYIEGDIYDGEWKDDLPGGHGKYTWANGDVYDGEWKIGQPNGQGTMNGANGQVYSGEWRDGRPNGHGTSKYPGGSIYDGEFKDGVRHGKGVLKLASGGIFEGNFENNLPGKGNYTHTDGRVSAVKYENGEFIPILF